MAEFMIVYHFLSTFTRYLFEFDKSLLKGVPFPRQCQQKRWLSIDNFASAKQQLPLV